MPHRVVLRARALRVASVVPFARRRPIELNRANSETITTTLTAHTPSKASRARVADDASDHVQRSNMFSLGTALARARREMALRGRLSTSSPATRAARVALRCPRKRSSATRFFKARASARATVSEETTFTLSKSMVRTTSRRALGLSSALWVVVGFDGPVARASMGSMSAFDALERRAKSAYYARDLSGALDALTAIIELEPEEPVWRERRGQVYVDLKRFEDAIVDYDFAEKKYEKEYRSLGMLSNRALAYEGLSRWREAIENYSEAIKYSEMVGAVPPYVLNSRGNCYNSVGEYQKALVDYERAAEIFQQSRNLSGAIYAASNAALMKVELGRVDEAIEDMEKVKRRAAGSVDMRAALAALYWSRGDEQRAEDNWNWSCEKINSGQLAEGGPVLDGCELYRDYDWLARIRRWPPSMVERFRKFISLTPP